MAESARAVVTARPPPFRKEGLGYIYEPITANNDLLGVSLKADYLSHRADDVTAEIVVECTLPGIAAHLHQGRLNLDATNAKRDLTRTLVEQTGIVNWHTLIEEFCVSILRAERLGEPFTTVGKEGQHVQRHFLVERLLPAGRASLLYGPWSVGKGWISVGLCVSIAAGLAFAGLGVEPGPTLYLDWEDDQEVFDERVWMICRGLGLKEPPTGMYYRACRGALSGQVHQIARFVAEHGVALCVHDSVGLASGSAGERGSYEESALALFDGLRYIRSTHLLIDHVSEEGRQNRQTVGKAYGSIYKMALVRNAWEIRKDQDLDAKALKVGLYHTKANHGPLLSPWGLSINFARAGACEITPTTVEGSTELSERLPVHARLSIALAEGPLSVKDLADHLGITAEHARKDLNRYTEKFLRRDDTRWELRAAENGAAGPGTPLGTGLVRPNGTGPELLQNGFARLDDGSVVPF